MPPSYRNTPAITLLRTLVRAHQAVFGLAAERVDRQGLQPTEFDMVMALGNTPGMRMCDLASRMLTSAPNVTRVVKSLEAKGLVERRRNPGCDREVVASLTAAGERLFAQAYPATYKFWKQTFEAKYTPQEMETLAALLARLGPPEA